MVELADTQVLGTCAVRRGGSTPSKGTISEKKDEIYFNFILLFNNVPDSCLS